jgi:hypothetical protein
MGSPSPLVASLSSELKTTSVHFGPPKESLQSAYNRVVSEKKTEFLRVNSLIRVEGETLKIREEYLLAAFGNEIKHGFFRTWLPREPMPTPEGGIAPGPSLTYQFESARRWWLPAELLEKWEPLVDSNELLPIPPAVSYPAKSETNPDEGPSALKLGSVTEPLEKGLYLYRIDYQVHGSVIRNEKSDSAGFIFSALAALDVPVRAFETSVQFRDAPKGIKLFPLVTEERVREGKISGGYHTEVAGERPPATSSTSSISALSGELGVQIVAGWPISKKAEQ